MPFPHMNTSLQTEDIERQGLVRQRYSVSGSALPGFKFPVYCSTRRPRCAAYHHPARSQ